MGVSTNDVKAGGAWIEVTGDNKRLRAELNKSDGLVKRFVQTSSATMSTLGKNIGASAAKSFVALNLAVGAASKAMSSFGRAVGDAMQRLRDSGADEQRESMAKLDAAVTRLKEKFLSLMDNVVSQAAGPATEAFDRLRGALNTVMSIINQLREKFAGAFDAIGAGASKITEIWNRFTQSIVEKSPMLAKAASDTLKKSGEDAMNSWAKDNSLLDQLDQINDKVNKSAEDIAKANSIVDQLKSRWGDVGIEVDQVTGQIKGLDAAQRKMYEAQNKARVAQLKLEQLSLQTQLKAIEAENQRTMAKAGPGAMSILGKWAANTAGVLAGNDYKSMVEIGEEQNQGAFEAARAVVDATKATTQALQEQSAALGEQIQALEAGQAWWEQEDRSPTEEKKTPVGTNTKAGSMTDKYAGMSPAEAEVEKLNQQYAQMLQDRILEIRKHGYSEEEATEIATKEFAEDRKAVDAKIAKIREEAAKKEAEILEGGASILKEAADVNKSDIDKELESIEQRYIDARKQMIDQLVALGKSEEEAARMADEHMAAERTATDKLKQIAIRRDQQEKAAKQAEEIQKQAEEAKKAEIEQARAYVDEIEKGLQASERTYTSSGGTFSAFDQLDTYNVAAESLNVEKQQLAEQKKLVDRMREMIDAYEAADTTTAVFA